MHIIVIGWIYVVLMMAITEHSVIAGIMTFLMYGVFPLSIILYLTGSRVRRNKRIAAAKLANDSANNSLSQCEPGLGPSSPEKSGSDT
jgi:hypothetical protein